MPHPRGPRRSVIDERQGIGSIVGGLILAAVITGTIPADTIPQSSGGPVGKTF
jgi:hypothetical protein